MRYNDFKIKIVTEDGDGGATLGATASAGIASVISSLGEINTKGKTNKKKKKEDNIIRR